MRLVSCFSRACVRACERVWLGFGVWVWCWCGRVFWACLIAFLILFVTLLPNVTGCGGVFSA